MWLAIRYLHWRIYESNPETSSRGQDKFIELMNIETNNLGLLNTHFTDSSGLDAGSYSTAKDLVVLMEYLLNKYPLICIIH